MPEPMPVWVLTGPSGGGKSTAAAFLADRGAAVIDADRVGHEVLREPAVAAAVRERFGDDVTTDGVVDRARLGARVFADPEALADLEALTHPHLSARLSERLSAVEAPLAVVEAAVYVRLPRFVEPDLVILVDASEETRRRRLVAAGLDAADARARIAAQRPLLPDWERSDIVITNDGDPDALHDALRALLRSRFPDSRGISR